MDPRLQEIIAATGELPALPSTTSRLLALLDDESAGADAVLEVIGTDASLTANLLKLSNSAYYGLRRHCLLYTSPSPRDRTRSRMPSSA